MADLDVAVRHWTHELAAWAVPDDILAAAPESPWGFPVSLFARAAEQALADPVATPSRARALEGLAAGGGVLDVGAGGGAASLPLAPPAWRLVAVDEGGDMLERFAASADARGVDHAEVHGRWPDVAGSVSPADVVVCHHVLYNVSDIVPFVSALTAHARRRVVVELTEVHPQVRFNALWRALHDLDRPVGPTADDAADVLSAMGLDVHVERFERASLWADAPRADVVAFARQRLCVGADRDAEIDALMGPTPDAGLRRLVTLWWDAP